MNKDEILAKSKKENIMGDEREKSVRVNRDAFSLWGFLFLGVIIMIIKLVHTQSPSDIISLLFCTSGLGFTYEGLKLNSKWKIISGIILLLCAAYFFYKFCVGLF